MPIIIGITTNMLKNEWSLIIASGIITIPIIIDVSGPANSTLDHIFRLSKVYDEKIIEYNSVLMYLYVLILLAYGVVSDIIFSKHYIKMFDDASS